jgi:hypothetical protein
MANVGERAHDERLTEQSPRLAVRSSRLREPNARLDSSGTMSSLIYIASPREFLDFVILWE